jgi:hypothetical protein
MGLVTVGIVAGIFGSIATILGLFKVSSKTKDSHYVKIKQTHNGVGDNIGGNKIIHKTPYTGVQTVCMLPPHLGGNDSLELDGAGNKITGLSSLRLGYLLRLHSFSLIQRVNRLTPNT